MSWSSRALSLLGRLLLWRARINRLQFLALYFALCFAGSLVGAAALMIVAATMGDQAALAIFDYPLWSLPYFLPLLYLAVCVVVARTHDLGWSAWIPILLYAGGVIPFALVATAWGMWSGLSLQLSEPI